MALSGMTNVEVPHHKKGKEVAMKMAEVKKAVMAFVKDEDGATAIEYALIAALIAVAIVTALTTTGTSIKDLFNDKVIPALGG
jgi:pilus assembly protein Flp/PilA